MLQHQIVKQYVVQVTTGNNYWPENRQHSTVSGRIGAKESKTAVSSEGRITMFQWWLSVLKFSREYTDKRLTEWKQAGIEIQGVILKALERLRYRN